MHLRVICARECMFTCITYTAVELLHMHACVFVCLYMLILCMYTADHTTQSMCVKCRVCVCMCVCVYVCVCIHTFTDICIHTLRLFQRLCMQDVEHGHIHLCVCVHCLRTYEKSHLCKCVRLRMCKCVVSNTMCVYMCLCLYAFWQTCTFVCVCVFCVCVCVLLRLFARMCVCVCVCV
jgi:hypothetical protein